MRRGAESDAILAGDERALAEGKSPEQRWAVRRAQAATLHRLPERMLVDRARAESAAARRAISNRTKLTG